MDVDAELAPIDLLAYITEELQGRFLAAKDDAAKQTKVFEDFLRRSEADPALDVLRNMKLQFTKDLDWFNVTQPLTMETLRGKLIVLDFFTYCCINCMHVLPELHSLEQRFPPSTSGLAVVGVHSPKFENEKDAANILSASQRYDIAHPIVNDPRSTLWRSIGIRCWPSLLVLSPDGGTPLLLLMGEGHGYFLECFTDTALRYYEAKGNLNRSPLPLSPSTDLKPASNLRFPAKIARSDDKERPRFAIADAGNHRILIVNEAGVVLQRIGGCDAGFLDGDFNAVRFNSPQGVSFLDADRLVVADTENHAIRQITLSKGQVETLVGTGQQGSDRIGGKEGPLQPIASPWDVASVFIRDMDMSFHLDERNVPEKPIVLIAMAGTHQIWGYFAEGMIWWKFRKFEPRTCVSLCGNGLEENRNNSYPQNAAFAQPSGLAMAKDSLFIADSESSSIRKVSMVDGKVTAVVGGDRNPLNLFAFGDIDGKQYNAKLQHPLGVAFDPTNGNVYVADTYNHKIKVIDPATNTIETLLIKDVTSGELVQFNEPAGLCFDPTGKRLLVADTNNHNILSVDMQSLKAQRFNLDFSQISVSLSETDAPLLRGGIRLLKQIPLSSCKQFIVRIGITLDEGMKFTAEAPQKWSLSGPNFSALQAAHVAGHLSDGKFTLELRRDELAMITTQEDIKLDIALSLCDANSCLMKRFSLILGDNGQSLEKATIEEDINIHITHGEIKLS